MTKPLIKYLYMVPDPRSGRKKKHDHAEILLCLILGYLAGRTTLRRALRWGRNNIAFLRKHLPYRNGIASPATACRLLSGLDTVCFACAFMEWIGEITGTRGKHLAIDGKALRGALEKVNVESSGRPMLLNVLEVATGLVVGQLPMENKESEIKAVPEMLKLLDIQDSTVTVDAIGTQTAIMDQIKAQGGHFVLVVKRNHPETYTELMETFGKLEADYWNGTKAKAGGAYYSYKYPDLLRDYDETDRYEKNRDRHEYRRCSVCRNPKVLTRTGRDWVYVNTVGRMQQTRIPLERNRAGDDITPDRETFLKAGSIRAPMVQDGDGMNAHVQNIGLISDQKLSSAKMMEFKRSHWSVENKLHHVLDDTFREDRSPAKGSRNSLSLIRKFAYNILRIAMINGHCSRIFTEAMDEFADDHTLMEEYVFNGIKSFY